MIVRASVILARLAHLGDALEQLERLQRLPAETRAEDPLYRIAAERCLHVAAEAVFDMGHHVLAGRGKPVPKTYREVIPALARQGLVSPDLEARLQGLAGLRNLLVHDYADVDATQLWAIVDSRVEDLREVQRVFADLPELSAV